MQINLFEPVWDIEMDEGPFRGRAVRIAQHAGARELGATLYELEPGASSPPYHLHHGNEELLLALSGSLLLRTPEGESRVEQGSVVAFPRGADGAHQLRNVAGTPARVLIVSTMHYPDVVEWLDTRTVQAIAGPGVETKVFPADADVPYFDELRKAGSIERSIT